VKDDIQAVALFKKACTSGNVNACAQLGWMTEQGRGVTADKAAAIALFRQACTGNDSYGCTQLTRLGETR